ncbi:MAG: FAD-binding oxidoreductase, partial [Pseudomonadota bacterium]
MVPERAEIAVIGAGIIGIATAYYAAVVQGLRDVVLIDAGAPMAFTSAQSGENYRNWWPHPAMVALTDRSIDLLEGFARETDNRIAMTRRGYVVATRQTDVAPLLEELRVGLGDRAEGLIRIHEKASSALYQPPVSPAWEAAPDGVDTLRHQALIRATFPSFDPEIQTVIHIRRGGDIRGQQLGMVMLERFREAGGRRLSARVQAIEAGAGFKIALAGPEGVQRLTVGRFVNAAGPFAGEIAAMLGIDLPLHNVFQQKIAFEDAKQAIPRVMPFAIDLDPQQIDWSEEERAMLREDPALAWLADEMLGAIHCRPDGGDGGRWLKLGWAFNDRAAAPSW